MCRGSQNFLGNLGNPQRAWRMPSPERFHATTNIPANRAPIHPIERSGGIWYNSAMKNDFSEIKEGIDGINYEISPINFIFSPTDSIISPINSVIDGIY